MSRAAGFSAGVDFLKGAVMSMKHRITLAGAGLFVVLFSVWRICAADAAKPGPLPAGEFTRIAMLDVNKLFKENEPFKKQMEKLKKEADDADKQAKDAQKLL